MNYPDKRTKIVCTLGPSSKDKRTILSMVEEGMNVARLNFSYGNYNEHKKLIDNIRSVADEKSEPIALMQDVQGPKIRLGSLPEDGIKIEQGQKVVFNTGIERYNEEENELPVDYSELHNYVSPGERVFSSDGRIVCEISEVDNERIVTQAQTGGTVLSNTGINAPDSDLEVRAVTEKDKNDIKFGVKQDFDFLAISFVRSAEDILDARYLIKDYEQKLDKKQEQNIKIIAKIERAEAIENIEEIMEEADGVMVARGDLGIEIPAQEVPLQQKKIIELAIENSIPVIVATQMLDSMQTNPRPTRAEVSDVSNAVIDHTDAVMLSEETATGDYPTKSVETMVDIIQETEKSHYDDLAPPSLSEDILETDEVLAGLSRIISQEINAKLILAASLSGKTARLISRCRPELPIVVATNNSRVKHQLNLSWGVQPFLLPDCHTVEELVDRSTLYLKRHELVSTSDKIIVIAGEPVGEAGNVNLLEVKEIE